MTRRHDCTTRPLALVGLTLLLGGCSQQQTDEQYWCSYETSEEAYQHCIDTGRDMDEHTAESAGKQQSGPR